MTVSGSASVIHHIAISTVIAATCQAVVSIPAGAGSISIAIKTARPPPSPHRRVCVIRPPYMSLFVRRYFRPITDNWRP